MVDNPEELRLMVMEDLARAQEGAETTTQQLFYMDVWADELHIDEGRKFLTLGQREEVGDFGQAIGVQLDDIRNWSKGVDGNRARRWDELAEEAMYGNAQAAEELGHELALRQMQHPNALRNVREMTHAVQNSAGEAVQVPIREGMVRVYFPTFKADQTEAVFLALPREDTTARRFLAGREDLSPQQVAAYESVGDGPLFAQSRYASTDSREVRDLVGDIQDNSRSVGQQLDVGVSYMDVPEVAVKRYYKDTPAAGSHDYEINFGDSMNATPIDFEGNIIVGRGEDVAAQLEDLDAAGEWLQARYDLARMDAEAAGTEAPFEEIQARVADILGRELGDVGTLPPEVAGWIDKGWIDIDDPLGNWRQVNWDLRNRSLDTTSPGISFESALDDAATKLNLRFDELFTRDGRILHEVTLPGVEAKGVSPEIAFDPRVPIPDTMIGPSYYVPPEEGWVSSIIRRGFDAVLTPLTNTVARHPLFINNAMRRVALSENLLRPLVQDTKLLAHAEKMRTKLDVTSTDALYNQLWNMPTDMVEVQKLVDEGAVSRQWLKLSPYEFDRLFEWKENERLTRKAVGDSAAIGALNDSIPFIDDHHVRSQFSDEVRNLIPFWWAQEAFFRRWAGTIAETPEAIRKAQLIMQGARDTGIVYQDEEGNDTFMIPLSNVAMGAIGGAVNVIMGGPFSMPVPVGISGQVRMATPGFDAVGVPGFGPLVGVPLAVARRLFPEVESLEQGLLGERGAGRNELEHIFPNWFVRFLDAATADDSGTTNDAKIASNTIQAMQYMEANGHGLKEDSTPKERQQYVDRVTQWARSMEVARVVFGWADPAPAQLEIGEAEVSEELVELMKHVGIEEALSEMLKRHPDATAYSIFSTKSVSGAPLEATVASREFMEANPKFIEAHPLASSWMLPQSDEQNESVRSVRALQLELGLRESKTPAEWYEDFKFGEAADMYFNSKESYEINREKLDTSKARAAYDEEWADWKQKYFKQHPVFEEQIQTRSGEERRKNVIDDMHRAYADPDLPDFAHKAELRVMLDSYDSYAREIKKLEGERGTDATDTRKYLRLEFAKWAKRYTTENPKTKLFYQRVILPDLDLTASQNKRFGE